VIFLSTVSITCICRQCGISRRRVQWKARSTRRSTYVHARAVPQAANITVRPTRAYLST